MMHMNGFVSNKAVSDEEILVTDFENRTLFNGYHTADYSIYEPFAGLKMLIDERLDALFMSGAVDDGNAMVLDAAIDALEMQAMAYLDKQKAKHIEVVNQLTTRPECDCVASEKELEGLKEDLKEIIAEQEKYKKKLEKCEFVQEGE